MKFDQQFFMGDLDHQVDMKKTRKANEKKKDDNYYMLQSSYDATGDQHYLNHGFFAQRNSSLAATKNSAMTNYNRACVLNIGHPPTEEKRKTISEERQKRKKLVQELERQKEIKQIQDKVRGNLMMVVNTDRLPQALVETNKEIQNMLTTNPVKAQLYEQMLTLNGQK